MVMLRSVGVSGRNVRGKLWTWKVNPGVSEETLVNVMEQFRLDVDGYVPLMEEPAAML